MRYNKNYSDAWIRDYEGGKDEFRVRYLEPFLKNVLKQVKEGETVLDIGCGWGLVLDNLNKRINYIGVDPNSHFFEYIKKRNKNKSIELLQGKLPGKIGVSDKIADLVIASMVLHTNKDLVKSVEKIFAKRKEGGKIVIIDFNNAAKAKVLSCFVKVEKRKDNFIRGRYYLPSGVLVQAEVYFHTEEEMEKEINKYGKFKKIYLGPLFVAYEIR